MDTRWKDPITGYVHCSFAGGLLQRILKDYDFDADVGDGDWFADQLMELDSQYRLALCLKLLEGTDWNVVKLVKS